MLQIEKNYDFRKRMSEIHDKDVRDNSLICSADELELRDGVRIVVSENAGEVIVTAARDLSDYLFVSMNMSSRVLRGLEKAVEGDIVIATADETGDDLGEYAAYKGEITTVDSLVRIIGHDERGAAFGVYLLEDMMSFRGAPYIKKGSHPRKPMYSPQMVHSGYGLDEYPDEHLSAIAHQGRDAILIFVKDVDKTPYGYLDFNDVIRRAKKYGLDVYAYSYFKSELHPDEPGAEAYYENQYGKLFRQCPELKGVTLVGESIEFPSKDPHVSGKNHRENVVDGIPTGKTSPGWYPCCDYPAYLELLKKVIFKYKPDADIVFWTYNWGFQPEAARVALIDNIPENISLQATFEMFESYKVGDITQRCADYTLSFCGPGKYFTSEAQAAKRNGIKFYSMTNTGGLTWDIGVIPYEPFPYQWIRRYKEMEKAHDEWGLCGLMESHHYGFYPSFISKLSKWVFSEPRVVPEEILQTILKSEFGGENIDKVDKAMRLWSDAITKYQPTNADQYGAFRVGPSYPFNIVPSIKIPQLEYAMFKSICFPSYNDYPNGVTYAGIRLKTEIEQLVEMRALIDEGIASMEEAEVKNEKLERLINMGKFISHTVTSGINAKKMHRLRSRLHAVETREELSAVLDEMEVLIKAEIKNAEETIPIVEVDSRLGWEPSMEYMTDRKRIEWKIRACEYTLNSEIPAHRNTLKY